jgi:hypothetical chaperone protein
MQAPSAPSAPRPPGIGLDYGTSNSVLAVFDGERLVCVPLETDSVTKPSAVHIDRQFQVCTGQQAIDRYIADNRGRRVQLAAEVLGEARTGTGQLDEEGLPSLSGSEQVFGQAFVDAGEKGRLFRGVKRLLGNAGLTRLLVFEKAFRPVALVTPLLLAMRQSLLAWAGRECPQLGLADHACLGHPVNFEGREAQHNDVALERLSEAARYAGFERQVFYPEPMAAALSYMHAFPTLTPGRLLAVDFGGGTLDLCILRRDGLHFEVEAIHGVGLGGDHLDQSLFRALLFPLLGKGESWRRSGDEREIVTLFPFELYEDLLLNWAVSYRLNQNEYTAPLLSCIAQCGEAAAKFERLYTLITSNLSFLVFQSLREVKAALSSQLSAVLDIPELDIELTVTRAQFESIIAGHLAQFDAAVVDTLAQARLPAQQIDEVVSTGGSSLIPAVRALLDARFPGRVRDHDPFTSVAGGLAIAEYRGLGFSREATPRGSSQMPG